MIELETKDIPAKRHDIPIGTTFKYGNNYYKIAKSTNSMKCGVCQFYNDARGCSQIYCLACHRQDNIDTIVINSKLH